MVAVAAVDRSTGASGDGGRGYVVKAGDTLSEIADRNNISLSALIRANPQISNPDLIRPGQYVNLPSGGGGGAPSTYTVRSGDTLSGIADRFGLDFRDIARDNGISNPNLIYPGQTLNLRGGGADGTGETGGVDGPGPVGGGSGNVLEIAQQYLGRNASDLKGDRSDDLPMQAWVPNNVNCANFVSAVLVEAGQLPAGQQTASVAQLNSSLRGNGWTPVSAQDARPGDVVIIQGGGVSHTEIYAGNGRMIGSNNTNADGSQRVGYDNLSWALGKGAVILRAPDSVRGDGNTGGTGGTGGVAGIDHPAATREGRIEQAVRFFESQGWSRNQAIGIAANLDAESKMDWRVQQHGGGPGFGLAQWEGPRQRDFAAWAGKDIRQSSFAEQLRFIQHELTGTERYAGNALRNAGSAADAASIVCRLYERPANSSARAVERADIANDIARTLGR